MPALADLKHSMRDLALKAHELVEDETKTAAEKRESLDKYDADIKALSEQIQDEEYLAAQRKSLGEIISTPEATVDRSPEQTKAFAEQMTSHPDFLRAAAAIKNGGRHATDPMELDGFFGRVGAKALLESGLASANVIGQDRIPGIVPILFERLTVADLMPNVTTNSSVVRAVVESTATNNAAPVAEGAAKPASVINYNIVDEPIRKIANYIKVSDEMLDDLPMVQGEVQGRLAFFVQLQEEAQILTGDGTGQNLTGILNRSITAAQAKGADSVAVAVHKEITKIRVASFLDPDAIVMHPNDWEGALLEQDANGQFYGPGPFSGAYGNPNGGGNSTYGGTYWGLRTVVTTSMTQNTALVGAFALGASVVRRRGITVTATNSDQDDFIKNLVTILAEERVGLRVIRPSAFGTVTGV